MRLFSFLRHLCDTCVEGMSTCMIPLTNKLTHMHADVTEKEKETDTCYSTWLLLRSISLIMSSFFYLSLSSIESTKFNLGYGRLASQLLLLLLRHHHLRLLLHSHLLHLHRHHRSWVHHPNIRMDWGTSSHSNWIIVRRCP